MPPSTAATLKKSANNVGLGTEQIGASIADRLGGPGAGAIRTHLAGAPCSVQVVIPQYHSNLERHYAQILNGESLSSVCRRVSVDCDFSGFGVEVRFDDATEIAVHDDDLNLDDTLRLMITRFGPIVLKNAFLPAAIRQKEQRNIFPHLNFHYDRGPNQPTQFSLFSRDPFDAVQRAPRKSSTVFIANIVGVLQSWKEGAEMANTKGLKSKYEIFKTETTRPLIGNIWMEQAWSEPLGVGEISILDNRTVLHASYYRDGLTKGYPIGVRYLR